MPEILCIWEKKSIPGLVSLTCCIIPQTKWWSVPGAYSESCLFLASETKCSRLKAGVSSWLSLWGSWNSFGCSNLSWHVSTAGCPHESFCEQAFTKSYGRAYLVLGVASQLFRYLRLNSFTGVRLGPLLKLTRQFIDASHNVWTESWVRLFKCTYTKVSLWLPLLVASACLLYQ